jgi:hypothetical protein
MVLQRLHDRHRHDRVVAVRPQAGHDFSPLHPAEDRRGLGQQLLAERIADGQALQRPQGALHPSVVIRPRRHRPSLPGLSFDRAVMDNRAAPRT